MFGCYSGDIVPFIHHAALHDCIVVTDVLHIGRCRGADFVDGLGYDGITWAVPFFGFSMLIALGVDYSIFLLDRFREECINGLSVKEALQHSMAKMGTVVITAAVILAGTFAAMMPSGVLSLIQIATIVITGLLLYGVVILPLLIPAITVSFGEGAWWPFRLKQKQAEN